MGQTVSACVTRDPARVLLLGLDAAGKTTVLYKFLKARETLNTFPTVGFNVEQVTCQHLPMVIWDFGGQMMIRNLRQQSLENNDAIIFVVDSADRDSFADARAELWTFLEFTLDLMEHPLLLVLANKQDLPNAVRVSQLVKVLGLNKLPKSTQWHIQPTCAQQGTGLPEALGWLAVSIKENRRKTVTTTYL